MSETTDRGYPFPESGDPISVHTDIQALAEAADVDVQSVVDNGTQALNQAVTDLREHINHEIWDLRQDVIAGDQSTKDYIDAEIKGLEQRLTALIESSQPDTSQLPVIGPWAVAAEQPTTGQSIGYGYIAGNGQFSSSSPSDYGDMRNWTQIEASLLDSTFHGDHRWENVLADDWVIVYNGGLHSATWRAKSEAQRNGDESVIITVEWVDGTTTDPADLGNDGFIHAHPESDAHFPI